ncbi:phenylalanine--tRNA ligase subunit beta [Marininema halotolerans]|uniref:Phenylalanine--tRNA ligase beta subunit n=1 Tax=Marininema halotolerans TaxID=1155944 RepID=A0A1I6S6U5_9BACL|nr:phenylalanine--tRNA ligase subunit beta [Marininema halotolerans]SFS72661.1 phenylalanyl-tRNA synthetase beta chain [Marininema halotolerans]
MLVSYRWLQKYVDLKETTPAQLAEALTRGGIEVDVIENRDGGVEKVIVGEVVGMEPHPDADKLRVCSVDVGTDELLQIVCGAANVAPGQKVPVAIHGAKLPGGIKIKKSKLRGVPSQGMICSAKELGLPEKLLPKEQQEGILVLPDEAGIGTDVKEILGLNDHVLELDLTPNRSDCLSMTGVAYEVAALLDREVSLPQSKEAATKGEKPLELVLDAEDDCPFYAAQVVEGLQVAPSPQWMQNILLASGIRPINNIVDITNYVMLEMGQPLHAFDYDQVTDGEIVVRRAHPGEQVVTLDGVTRACDAETLLITDGTQPIGIAGVMGGANSEVKETTTTLLLESAYFAPPSIRKAARKLGLRSEASSRFEKGVDPERIIPALNRAVELLGEYALGKPASNVKTQSLGGSNEVTVTLRHERLIGVLGVQIPEEAVQDIFRRLRFPMEKGDGVYHVQVPSRRPDISIEVDLIEEVARLYGYHRIPTTLPWGQQSPGVLTEEQRIRRIIRRTLQEVGLFEVLNYSLTSPARLSEVEFPLATGYRPIRLTMPMSDERKVLRTCLIPQLIETAEYNVHRREAGAQLFELGKIYLSDEKKLTQLPEERWELAGLITGETLAKHWDQEAQSPDFFSVKGILEHLFLRLGVKDVSMRSARYKGWHPGRTAEILLDGTPIGLLGQLHPQVEEAHDLGETYAFQVAVAPIITKVEGVIPTARPLPRYPAVTRDLALVVDQEVPVAQLEATIREIGADLVESVTLFDMFTGAQIGEGKKNIAYALNYRAEERTLTDDEVNLRHDEIVAQLSTRFDAKLRQ